MENWCVQLETLSFLAIANPQCAYAVYTHGFSSKFSYIMRTIPRSSIFFEPIETILVEKFIPALFGRNVSPLMRDLVTLPSKMGGLGISNPVIDAEIQFQNSLLVTDQLKSVILLQQEIIPDNLAVNTRNTIRSMKTSKYERLKIESAIVKEAANESLSRSIEILDCKSSSIWLTALPIEEEGFVLDKQSFRDALCLRYGLILHDFPQKCPCGSTFDANHAMICRKGGFVHMRHDGIRNHLSKLLSEVCVDVRQEPSLQPLTTEHLTLRSANSSENARLDISARNFRSHNGQRAFFDVRVFYPNAPSHQTKKVETLFKEQENEKKRCYNERVMEIEHGVFTPLIFGSTGGQGKECDLILKRLAYLLSEKLTSDYSKTISAIRCELSFFIS